MTVEPRPETPRRPLRLWPGVVIVVVGWVFRLVLPAVAPEIGSFAVLGGAVAWLGVIVWWVLFSRAAWLERVGAVLVMVVALAATRPLLHESIRSGNMGLQFFFYATPILALGFVGWAVVTRRLSARVRRFSMVATILVACGGFALLRSDGLSGEGAPEFNWRWAATPEERLLAGTANEPVRAPVPPTVVRNGTEAAWPGFRGPDRDGSISGVRIATDWAATPPVALWRRPVGPAVSSFAVAGGLLYTQEQRGDEEIVASYRVATGEPVWRHGDRTRFWDAHVGAGPRGTPAYHDGRVFALGATGTLSVLDAVDGRLLWSRGVASDTEVKVPEFGFTGSPLVVDDIVVVATGGRLAAYEVAGGSLRWIGPQRGGGYSSPHWMTIGGVPQVLLLSGAGATSVLPADGRVLWTYDWPGYSYVQPALTGDGDLLVSDIDFMPRGMRRLAVSRESGDWAVQERWNAEGLKPHFSDFVVYRDHVYGFDGSVLACMAAADGRRVWKGGRYGHGQLILLRDQGVLVVLSEHGELALVAASPDGFEELGQVPAIEGRTWNHPALAGTVVLVRNSEEMAAFQLAPAG